MNKVLSGLVAVLLCAVAHAQTSQTLSPPAQLQANMAEDLGKLRTDLGRLKIGLQNDRRALQLHGNKMSPADRNAIMSRINQGMAQEAALENRIVANDPAAARALAVAREERRKLGMNMDAVQRERQGLLHDSTPNPMQSKPLSSLDDTISKLAKDSAAAEGRINAALGMTPVLMAGIDLDNTQREIDDLGKRLSDPKLPPAERQRLLKHMDGLQAKARDIKNFIATGNSQAQR